MQYKKIKVPFLAVFLTLPNCPVTSCNLFSSSCFFSAICSSLDLPLTFLSIKNKEISNILKIYVKYM